VAPDGRLLVDGRADRRPLLVQTYASTVRLAGVRRVRHQLIFDLYRPTSTPRLELLAAGRYADRWLAPRGAITVWTKRPGTLDVVLTMPTRSEVTPIHFGNRLVRVHPGERVSLHFHVPGGGPWSVHFQSDKQGYLGDRAVSSLAPVVRFR